MSPEKILKNDGIGVLPTDTLYGVVGSAFSKKAVQRIYALKGRDENKPFIVLLAGYTDLKLFGVKPEMQALFKKQSEATRRPTSIILPVTQKKFEYLHRGTKSIAFRMPKNKLLVALLKKIGPLVAPSANPQGLQPAKNITEAKKYFGEAVDFYVPGPRKAGKPSRLIAIEGETIRILRP